MKLHRACLFVVFLLMSMAFTIPVIGASVPQENLQLWLRADLGVELQGPGVMRWVDQSGQENHAYGEMGTMPTLAKDAVNGQPVLVFDGKSSFVTVPHRDGLNAGEAFTIFVVYRYAEGNGLDRLMQKRSSTVGIGVDGWYVAPARGAGVASVRDSSDRFAAGEYLLHTAVFDFAGKQFTLYRDGVVVTALPVKAPQTANNHPLFIGKREHSNEAHMEGEIAEILIYNTALDNATRAQVDSYLIKKYGL